MAQSFSAIRTDRLILDRLTIADVARLVDYKNDADIAVYQAWPMPFTVDVAEHFVAGTVGNDLETGGQLAIRTLDGELIGDMRVERLTDVTHAIELGITLAAGQHRRGYASEAIRGVVDSLFASDTIHKLIAYVAAANEPSLRLFDSLGFVREGLLSDSFRGRNGELITEVLFGRTRSGRHRREPLDHPESDARIVFASIESQTTLNDRRSLIAVRDAVRRVVGPYGYLEIGSHLGGTLQAFVLDHNCVRLWSIDKRPASQPDERGPEWAYPDNSTERMVSLLRTLDPTVEQRLACFDFDASGVEIELIDPRPHLLFVDGEHTDHAVFADAEFCRRVMHRDGSILVFHDAHIVYNGLRKLFESWHAQGVSFTAYHLADCLMVVEFGLEIHLDPSIRPLLLDNHVGFLASLSMNDSYREIARRFPARQYWRLRLGIGRRFGRRPPFN